jgi:hypothetical protein
MMDAIYTIIGAGVFACGAIAGWKAAFAIQEKEAPSIFTAKAGESNILDPAPEREAANTDPDAPVF